MGVLAGLFALIRAFLTPRFVLVAENLALRHQLTVLSRSVKRPKLRPGDRLFWVLLSRFWQGWCLSLHNGAASDGGQMAPRGFQTVLAMAVKVQEARPARNRCRDPGPDPTDVPG